MKKKPVKSKNNKPTETKVIPQDSKPKPNRLQKHIDHKRTIEMYMDGMGITAIAKVQGCHKSNISNYLKAHKVPKPKKKPPKLSLTKEGKSIRDRLFAKSLLEGNTPTQAMRDAGYAESTALARQSEKVGQVAETIQELMDRKGITDSRLLDVLNRGLDATKTISAMVMAKNGDGMADAHSMTKDFIDVPDFAVQHKYMETGLKLKGHLKDATTTYPNSPVSINIELMGPMPVKQEPRTIDITEGTNGAAR